MIIFICDIIAFFLLGHLWYVIFMKPVKRLHYIISFGFWLGLGLSELVLTAGAIYYNEHWTDILLHAFVMFVCLWASQDSYDIICISDEIRKAFAGLRQEINKAKAINPDIEVMFMINPTQADIQDMANKMIEKDKKD